MDVEYNEYHSWKNYDFSLKLNYNRRLVTLKTLLAYCLLCSSLYISLKHPQKKSKSLLLLKCICLFAKIVILNLKLPFSRN